MGRGGKGQAAGGRREEGSVRTVAATAAAVFFVAADVSRRMVAMLIDAGERHGVRRLTSAATKNADDASSSEVERDLRARFRDRMKSRDRRKSRPEVAIHLDDHDHHRRKS